MMAAVRIKGICNLPGGMGYLPTGLGLVRFWRGADPARYSPIFKQTGNRRPMCITTKAVFVEIFLLILKRIFIVLAQAF